MTQLVKESSAATPAKEYRFINPGGMEHWGFPGHLATLDIDPEGDFSRRPTRIVLLTSASAPDIGERVSANATADWNILQRSLTHDTVPSTERGALRQFFIQEDPYDIRGANQGVRAWAVALVSTALHSAITTRLVPTVPEEDRVIHEHRLTHGVLTYKFCS